MKRLKHFMLALAIVLISFTLPTVVKATNVTYKAKIYTSISTDVYVNGLDKNLEEGYKYYVHIAQDNTIDTNTLISNVSMAKYATLSYDNTSNQYHLGISSYSGIFEKTGDYYIYLMKGKMGDKSTFEVLNGPTKLDAPENLSLGSRINVYYSSNSTSVYIKQFSYYTKMYGTDRKMKFHIGKISDKNLLKELSNNNSNANEKLYEYAKQSSNYIYSGEFDTTKTAVMDYNILSGKMTVEPGEYYFGYYELDDENGTYVKLDDIQAYKATQDGILDNFTSYDGSDEEVDENSGNTASNTENENVPTKNNNNNNDATAITGKLPKTGKSVTIVASILLVVVVGIFAYFKYSYLKGI